MERANSSIDVGCVDMQKLVQLAIQGDYGQVRQLATAHLVKAVDEGGRTVFMLAADAELTPQPFSKCIEYFLHLGADAKAADLAGNTAAHVAAGRNNVQMLALLPFEAKWLANKEGVTPLMEAVQKGKLQCAKHLLHLFRQLNYSEQKSKLLEMKNRQELTALDIAKVSCQTDLVRIIQTEMQLVFKEGDLGTLKISGLSASEAAEQEKLQLLARSGDLVALERVTSPVNCDLPNADGWTPLMWAAHEGSGRDEVVQLLLSRGADATCASVDGYSCLHRAARKGRAGAAFALLQAGAPANSGTAVYSRTPLMHAAYHAPHSTAAACIQALISAGANWNLKSSNGDTALDVAKKKGRRDLAALLDGYNGKSFFDEPLEMTKQFQQQHQTARSQHVMISYSQEQKQLVVPIRDALVRNNIKVWIDYECMKSGSTISLMSQGVEASYAFLMCMSRSYNKSKNCQMEAEYAWKKEKLIVPLLMEPKFRPDTWLGIILGADMYLDFSGKYPFDVKLAELLKILEQAKHDESH